jgi:uncharacterized protein YraI
MRASNRVRFCFATYLLVLSAAAVSQNAFITHSVSVYAGPDDSYPAVAELDADAPVQVMGCLDDWSWCDVAFEDNRGWVYAPDVIYYYEGGYVPLYTYAPSLGIPVVQFTIGVYWDRYYRERPWYAHREEWMHREPPHHRPPGPPPSVSPPPRSARIERPVHEPRPFREAEAGRSPRPGNSEPSHRQPEPPHREIERAPLERAGPPPHEETSPGRARPPQHEETSPGRARPPQHEEPPPGHEETSPGRTEARRPEEHSTQTETPRHEERPHPAQREEHERREGAPRQRPDDVPH